MGNGIKQIDIIRTSSSRPELLELTTESWKKYLKFDGELRWILHEDVLNSDKIEAIKKIGSNYDIFQINNPAIGQGESLFWLLEQVKTKLILYIEDDWKLLKEINLDELYDLMYTNTDINQITFNKRAIMAKKQWFIKKEIKKDNISLVTDMYWTFIPSLWRIDWIKPKIPEYLKETSGGTCSYGLNDHLRKFFGDKMADEDFNADWVIANTGTYFLGNLMKNYKELVVSGKMDSKDYDKLDNGFYVQHLGYTPYEPENWHWPLVEPPKVRKYKNITEYTNNRKGIPRTKDNRKWNPWISKEELS